MQTTAQHRVTDGRTVTKHFSPGETSLPPPRESGRGVSIVIADSDADLVRLAVDHLSQEYETLPVFGFSESREAAAVVARSQPALLICSPQMPRVGGMDLITLTQKRWGQLPTIVLVSGSGLGPGGHLRASGKIIYLEKPFTKEALQACIVELTGLRPLGSPNSSASLRPVYPDLDAALEESLRTPPRVAAPVPAEDTHELTILRDPEPEPASALTIVAPAPELAPAAPAPAALPPAQPAPVAPAPAAPAPIDDPELRPELLDTAETLLSDADAKAAIEAAAVAAEIARAQAFAVAAPSTEFALPAPAAAQDGARTDSQASAGIPESAVNARRVRAADAAQASASVAEHAAPERRTVLTNFNNVEPSGEVARSLSSITPLPASRPPRFEFSDIWAQNRLLPVIQSEESASEQGTAVKATPAEPAVPDIESNHPKGESAMALTSSNIKENLAKLETIDGFMGIALADSDNGMCLGSLGGATFNLEVAAAANTEVVRSKRKAIKTLNLRDEIEDILITLGKQYHIIRPVRSRPNLFYYLVLDRQRSNLAMARYTLAEVERELPM